MEQGGKKLFEVLETGHWDLPSPYLRKCYELATFQEQVKALSIEPELKSRLISLYSRRSSFHLLRLLSPGRSNAEYDFAVSFIRNFEAVRKQLGKDNLYRKISEVIESEGADTCLWWTFAPYLHSALLGLGCEEDESILRILKWASDGKSVLNSDNVNRENEWHFIHLKGLEYLQREYALGKDPNDSSHQLTKQLAEIIAQEHLLS